MKCRHCEHPVDQIFADLGSAPPSNAYLAHENDALNEAEFPLRVLVCEHCWLVQTEDFASADTFFADEYAYFSSYSSSWLEHSKDYVDKMAERFELNHESLVVEIAANDGYLLQFVSARNIPCFGVEPTAGTASAARDKGVEIVEEFFGENLANDLAKAGRQADLMTANNVLAHVPDINDFVKGFSILLKKTGVATFEFPHVCELIDKNQFDTIYHEHFSYLSITTVNKIFQANGLQIFDVEKLPTHGGSLRVYAQRISDSSKPVADSVARLLKDEHELGVDTAQYYASFNHQAQRIKSSFVDFLSSAKADQKKVVGYGAAAKGNTLLNYSGVGKEEIDYVVDRNPEKQGKLLPGSHIPIVSESLLEINRPDFIVIFPWNLVNEISKQLEYTQKWGAKLVTFVPEKRIYG
ncbi:MAG: class I SAM-dependent methyltransferase [Pseudomonadota bacterium]